MGRLAYSQYFKFTDTDELGRVTQAFVRKLEAYSSQASGQPGSPGGSHVFHIPLKDTQMGWAEVLEQFLAAAA